jgi:hypothetical protein
MDMALRSMLGLTEPHTFELVDQRMATIMASGDPRRVGQDVIPVLYESVNRARKERPFDLEPLRARWTPGPTRALTDRPAMWGLPVPANIQDLPQVDDEHPVRIDVWQYGTVAEILHEGSRAEEGRAIDRLRKYMDAQGYEVIGPHEEEYLTPPNAPIPKTLIRYRVRCR